MKVLIYVYSFAPKIGGAEKYVMLLAGGLAQARTTHDISVTVVTPTPADGFDDADLPFRVVRRPTTAALWRLIGETDIIHLAGPVLLPLMLSLARRKRTVIEHHGYQAVCPNGLLFLEPTKMSCPGYFMKRRYRRCLSCNAHVVGPLQSVVRVALTFVRRFLCRRVARNVTVSRHVQQRLELPRSMTIYHGVPDCSGGAGRPTRKQLPSDSPRLLYVGRLVSEKGLQVLLDAVSCLAREGYTFQLIVVGDGPEREMLKERVERLQLKPHVSFTGFLHGEELEEAVADSAALVMPSLWEETAGLVAIEHLMRGGLVIASDVGGLREMVEDAGLLFKPGDPAALAHCLRRVLDNPDTVRDLKRRARARAEQLFRQDQMVAGHANLYRSLLIK